MKKILSALTLATTATLVGCASPAPHGGIYNGVTYPVQVTEHAATTKTGEATCHSFLALFAFGDCSFETAKSNGGITKVASADWKANNILGIVGHYTLTVKGE